MPKNNFIEKDLSKVNNLIRNNIIEEETISNLYEYIFRTNGKQLRAQLSLISSSIDKRMSKRRLKLAAVIELLHTATHYQKLFLYQAHPLINLQAKSCLFQFYVVFHLILLLRTYLYP